MIIKSHSQKTFTSKEKRFSNTFEEKIYYVFGIDETLEYVNKKNACHPVFHNLETKLDDTKAIENEFFQNFTKYHSKRKNRVVLFHEKISFAPEDREFLLKNPEVGQDIVKKWLDIRAKGSLGYAKMHQDKEHLHYHVLISGNLLGSSKQLRLSKKEFREFQWELELYLRQKYPEIEQRDFYKEGYKSKELKQFREFNGLKDGKNQKVKVAERVRKCLQNSKSFEAFTQNLKVYGLEYYRRGKVSVGVKLKECKELNEFKEVRELDSSKGRKFRFKTLGLSDTFEQAVERWGRVKRRDREFQEIVRRKEERKREKELKELERV